MMQWDTVIGLEIHTRLKTQSKIFSGASAQYGAEANEQACAVDVALPGVLPVLNEQALQMIITFGCAVEGQITRRSVMARKHYFYPDLPKGYQISQYEDPVVIQGRLQITLADGKTKTIRITRAHLEEDAGKLIHDEYGEHGSMSAVDLNRAGTSLMEIVSEPDMNSAEEAITYMKKVYSIVKYLDICDGNMQEGSFRCDVNVSVKPVDSEILGIRAEIKNVNSFRFVEKAINFEVERQIDILESGGKIVQETRLFDSDAGETRSMRSKEEAHDYRYFPDPDLLPIEINDAYITAIRDRLPELPDQKRKRFLSEYHLNESEIEKLIDDKDIADYFEACNNTSAADAKTISNWLNTVMLGKLNKENVSIREAKVTPQEFSALLNLIHKNIISGKIAKQVFEKMWAGEGNADEVVERYQLRQINNLDDLEIIIERIIKDNPKQVEQYRSGKEKLLAYFVGQVMKATQGKANPAQVNDLLKKNL